LFCIGNFVLSARKFRIRTFILNIIPFDRVLFSLFRSSSHPNKNAELIYEDPNIQLEGSRLTTPAELAGMQMPGAWSADGRSGFAI